MTRKMIIDTDTASDDDAIMLALQSPDIEVEAITIVSGTMSVAQGSINARYVVELCSKNTPVYHGVEKPLMRETGALY